MRTDFADPDLLRCLRKIGEAQLEVRIFDLTNDFAMPVAMAFLWSGSPEDYFDVASGVCAHPSPARAIKGAIEEAAQTRISNIAGARDDIDPVEYEAPLAPWIKDMLREGRTHGRPLPPPMLPSGFSDLGRRIGGTAIAVPLSSANSVVCVVKVLSDVLEDRATNARWRPGARATRAMTRP